MRLGATPARQGKGPRQAQALFRRPLFGSGAAFRNACSTNQGHADAWHDLRVYLSTYGGLGNGISYYRDDKGLEVDAVIEYGGRWAGIEIKLSDTKADEGARSLLTLRDKVMANPAARNAEPLFLAVIVGRGSLAYQRDDGVLVIPIALLGA